MMKKRGKVLQSGKKTAEGGEILNITEAAKLLRVSKPVVYHLIHEKKIPALKAGNKWRFSRQGIIDALSKLSE
jgi:excisionase family DNA binding protein